MVYLRLPFSKSWERSIYYEILLQLCCVKRFNSKISFLGNLRRSFVDTIVKRGLVLLVQLLLQLIDNFEGWARLHLLLNFSITQEEDVHNDCEDGNLCGPEKGTQDNHSAEPTVADVDDGEIEDGDDDAFNDVMFGQLLRTLNLFYNIRCGVQEKFEIMNNILSFIRQ